MSNGRVFENGRLVSTYNDEDALPTIPPELSRILGTLPSMVLEEKTKAGGLLWGWYHRRINANAVEAIQSQERLLGVAVKIAHHMSQLAIITNRAHIAKQMELAALKIDDDLGRLRAQIAARDHLEELLSLKRRREIEVVRAREERARILAKKTPQEIIGELILAFEKDRAKIESNSELSPEGRQMMIYQLEALRDAEIVEAGGVPPLPRPPVARETRTTSKRKRTTASIAAQFAAQISAIRLDTSRPESERLKLIDALTKEMELECAENERSES
ncbi:MAG: hypothetical protein OMOMHJEC_03299 [Xanthomonadales bacterium]|nr:hypothetical protein [Xanthomonadales bacterium]